jgi:RNA 3'-phosphate cyclase
LIVIDGSYGEGGGQILRTAIALSAVTGKPCKITNIRKGRCNPGLQAQHLEAINTVAHICGANVKGNIVGSQEIEFSPGKIKSGDVSVKIPTAGSVGLVLQSVMIVGTHAKELKIIIEGGATNGKWAAPVNYVKNVLCPLLEKMGYRVKISIERYGYYPKGGAKISATMKGANLKPLSLTDRGKLLSINGISHASAPLNKSNVAERQKDSADKILCEFNIDKNISSEYVDSLCIGSGIDLYAIFEKSVVGSDGLGEIGKKAEDVGKEAALKLLKEIKSEAAVDEHAEDQLLPYMALSGSGSIKVPELTQHTKTNIWVIEKFLPVKFDIIGKIISCKSL